MDFLDPRKQRRHRIVLICGYILIGCMVIGATTVLLYEAYGYGFGKNGSIIQNGLVYLSSQPHPATITLNGHQKKTTTDASLTLPEGIYNFQLSRSGYRTWSRNIEIDGGTIEDYTYPLLVPAKIQTTDLKSYTSSPAIATQSLNRQWLLIQQPGSDTLFDLYNLSNPTLSPTIITIPSNVISTVNGSQSWQVVGWANDNQHVLLNHLFDGKNEYVMVDIANPSQSFNLSQDLAGLSYTTVSLDNLAYNRYYLYNSANGDLMVDSLSAPTTPTTILSGVINYDGYNGNTVLYATETDAPANKVNIDELVGTTNYHLKTLSGGTSYLLDMAGYSGSIYVAIGATSENKVYVYDNPIGQLQADPRQAIVPLQVMLLNKPSYVGFSTNAQFIMSESGNQFAVYNLENSSGYNYTTDKALDKPQTNATWIDGDRLTYASGGQLVMFEYDDNYQQTLMPASSSYLPFFTTRYDYVYSLVSGPNSTYLLTRTSLYTPADQPQKT